MLVLSNQRWRRGRSSYRPAGEVIHTHSYEVAELARDTDVKAFVSEHHYSRSYPAARFRFGLFRHGELVGAAVFSQPCQADVILNTLPVESVTDGVELGRFILLDDVPGNGETWFLARCFELLKQRVFGVVSYSDPVPRSTADGEVVFPGHIGTIYQAFNGVYLGRAKPRTLRLFDDGTVFSDQSMSKIRLLKRGWRYAAKQLQDRGAGDFTPESPKDWLHIWRDRLTRTVRHPGNLKYAWAFDKAMRKLLVAPDKYPKKCSVCSHVSPEGRVHQPSCPNEGTTWARDGVGKASLSKSRLPGSPSSA